MKKLRINHKGNVVDFELYKLQQYIFQEDINGDMIFRVKEMHKESVIFKDVVGIKIELVEV